MYVLPTPFFPTATPNFGSLILFCVFVNYY
jgi:hypothetical protein